MPEAWRIVRRRYAGSALTGEGACGSGGRWNSPGVPVVYASSTKSLATLETLVHLNPPMNFEYVAFHLTFHDLLVQSLNPRNLPVDWRSEPPPRSTKAVGDLWVNQKRSALLTVPSVITGETNYLLNPAHADFKRISISRPQPFVFDPRLLS